MFSRVQNLIKYIYVNKFVKSPKSNTQNITSDSETKNIDLEHQEDADLNMLFFQENAEGFQMEETLPPARRDESLVNMTESLEAFTFCAEFCGVFVEEISTKRVYELNAPSFIRGRPFSNLDWIQDKVLAFDQSTQPHQRIHYIVEIEKKELINA